MLSLNSPWLEKNNEQLNNITLSYVLTLRCFHQLLAACYLIALQTITSTAGDGGPGWSDGGSDRSEENFKHLKIKNGTRNQFLDALWNVKGFRLIWFNYIYTSPRPPLLAAEKRWFSTSMTHQ